MLRAPGNVRSVAAVVGRVRRGASTFVAVSDALSGLVGILYSTHERRERAHDLVIVLPFARPASRQEHARAFDWLGRSLGRRAQTKGVLLEHQPGAFTYLPSWLPGQPWKAYQSAGTLLDPESDWSG